MWFRLFATALVPLTSLIYCNAKILIYYRENNFTKAYTAMRKLNQNTGARESNASELNGKVLEITRFIVYNVRCRYMS